MLYSSWYVGAAVLRWMATCLQLDCCTRRVGDRTGLLASYGANKFVVKYPAWFKDDYAAYVKHMTFYGRLINTDTIINLDMEFALNDTVRG